MLTFFGLLDAIFGLIVEDGLSATGVAGFRPLEMAVKLIIRHKFLVSRCHDCIQMIHK